MDGSWQFDKTINISEILALLALACGLLVWAVRLEGNMSALEAEFSGEIGTIRAETHVRHEGVIEMARANRNELDRRLLITVPRTEYEAMVRNLFLHIGDIKESQAETRGMIVDLSQQFKAQGRE